MRLRLLIPPLPARRRRRSSPAPRSRPVERGARPSWHLRDGRRDRAAARDEDRTTGGDAGREAPVLLGSTRSGAVGIYRLHYRGARAGAVKYLLATGPFEAGALPSRARRAAGTGSASPSAKGRCRNGSSPTSGRRWRWASRWPSSSTAATDRREEPGAAQRGGDDAGPGRPARERRQGAAKFPTGNRPRPSPPSARSPTSSPVRHRPGPRCTRFLALAGAPGGGPGPDTLAAVRDIARDPWHDVGPPLQALAAPPGPRSGRRARQAKKNRTPGPWRCASKAPRRASTVLATSRSTAVATSGSPTTTPTRANRGARLQQRKGLPLHPHRRDLPRLPYTREAGSAESASASRSIPGTGSGSATSASKARGAKRRRTTPRSRPSGSRRAKSRRRGDGKSVG